MILFTSAAINPREHGALQIGVGARTSNYYVQSPDSPDNGSSVGEHFKANDATPVLRYRSAPDNININLFGTDIPLIGYDFTTELSLFQMKEQSIGKPDSSECPGTESDPNWCSNWLDYQDYGTSLQGVMFNFIPSLLWYARTESDIYFRLSGGYVFSAWSVSGQAILEGDKNNSTACQAAILSLYKESGNTRTVEALCPKQEFESQGSDMGFEFGTGGGFGPWLLEWNYTAVENYGEQVTSLTYDVVF